ncbi:MAG: Nif11 family protein [Synechococcus sp. s2_metabat2_7]|nr:Nif11 family protein [Synechococcus sp. s2_metabat2_7]
MSREGWKDFLNAAERSPALQRELNACKETQDIIQIGKRLGFALCLDDLNHDAQAEAIGKWFEQSTIQ